LGTEGVNVRPKRTPNKHVSKRVGRAILTVGLVVGLVLGVHSLLHKELAPTKHPGGRAVKQSGQALDLPGEPIQQRLASVSGRVCVVDGRPLANARVCATEVGATWLGSTNNPFCAATDEAGEYLIAGLPPGRYSLAAQADGFLPTSPDAQLQVAVSVGDLLGGYDFKLVPGGDKLEGFVMDATGGPVAGAVVHVSAGAPLRELTGSQSAEDGHFAVWVSPGTVTLVVEATGYAPARLAHVAPSSDVVVRLTPGSTIEGKVVGFGDEKPVPNITVRAVPTGMWESPTLPSDISLDDGRFSIHSLQVGTYHLVAEGEGWRGEAKEAIDLGVAQVVGSVRVVVTAAAHVTGRVVRRSDGQPCTQGLVTLGPASAGRGPFDPPSEDSVVPTKTPAVPVLVASIGEGGTVAFRSVPTGTYHVTIQSPDLQLVGGPRILDVPAAGVDDQEWKVDVGLGMVIHVVDETERPIPRSPIRIVWPERAKRQGALTMPVVADAEGTYRVPQVLYPGIYRIEPGGGYDGAPLDVDLRDGMAALDVTLKLRGRGAIVASIKANDGQPLDSVTVTAALVKSPDSTAGTPGTAGASTTGTSVPMRRVGVAVGGGRFRIGPLPDGIYRLEVSDGVNPPTPAGDSPKATVRIASGADVEVDITLDRGATLRGRVVDEARQPVADAWVSAVCTGSTKSPTLGLGAGIASSGGSRVLSDLDGRFVLRQLAPAAECTVRAEQPYASAGVLQGVHADDGELAIVLPALGTVQGSAIATGGPPAGPITLTLRETLTGRSQTATSNDGQFRFVKVVPGHEQLVASDMIGHTGHLAFDLGSGASLDGIRLELHLLQAQNVHAP
jgi:protocatechuate 3,4-dioxygenase beta subunit